MRMKSRLNAGVLLYIGLCSLLALGLLKNAFAPKASNAQTTTTTTPAAAPAGHPLDEPLRLLAKARQVFSTVQDYTYTMIKQERIGGTLQPVNVMSVAIRQEPFSVYMKWLQPTKIAGQEACYVTGKNGGKMRAHSVGILGKVGFVSIDTNDPRAMKHSNHSITEAGVGNLLNRLTQTWSEERKLNRVQVKMGEYEYNKRRCIRVDATKPNLEPGTDEVYRSVVYFDKELGLPIRVEIYDRPKPGGKPGSDVVEMFSYIDLKLNVGLSNATFDK